MHRHRLLLTLTLAGLAPVLFAGCRNGATTDATDVSDPSMAGVSLSVAVPQELKLAEHWRIAINEWETETNAACELHEYDGLLEIGSGTPAFSEGTLVVCPLNQVFDLHAATGLAVMPEEELAGWRDVFDALRNSVGTPGSQPTVFPLSTPPLVCLYRTDLLEASGLSPPTSWSEYRRLLATIEDWAPGHAVVEPWGENVRATMFLQRAAGYALHPDNLSFALSVSTGEPQIGQPPFVRTLEEIVEDLSRLNPESVSMDPVKCYHELAEGRAALGIGFVPNPAAVGDTEIPPIGILPIPGADEVYHAPEQVWLELDDPNSVTVVGQDAWVACVTGGDGPTSAAAWNLWNSIDAMESRVGSRFLRNCRPDPPTEQTAAGSRPNISNLNRQYRATLAAALQNQRVVSELPLPGHARYREALTNRLNEVLEDGRAPADALSDLADDWESLSGELGKSTVLNGYRWSLGLSPVPAD